MMIERKKGKKMHRFARAAAFALMVPLLVAACSANGDGAQSAQQYAVEHMSERVDAASAEEPWYRSLDELLPNVKYAAPGKSQVALSEVVVAGSIIDITKGFGFAIEGEDAPSGVQVNFDDSAARWKTVHLRVSTNRGWGKAPAVKVVNVGMAVNADVDFTKFATGLKSLGTVVMFLEKSPVFAYDPSLYGVVKNGGMLAAVDGKGKLTLPFLETEEAAALLGGVPTLDDLETQAKKPERVIALKREGGLTIRN